MALAFAFILGACFGYAFGILAWYLDSRQRKSAGPS